VFSERPPNIPKSKLANWGHLGLLTLDGGQCKTVCCFEHHIKQMDSTLASTIVQPLTLIRSAAREDPASSQAYKSTAVLNTDLSTYPAMDVPAKGTKPDPLTKPVEPQHTSTEPQHQQRRFNARPDLSSKSTPTSKHAHRTRSNENYPFGHLCPPGSDLITLHIGRNLDNESAYLIPEDGFPDEPLYLAKYSSTATKKINTITHHEEQSADTGRQIVKITLGTPTPDINNVIVEPAPNMEFTWGEWAAMLLTQNSFATKWGWMSDVGTLEGHTMEWFSLGIPNSGGWVIRCFDADDKYRDVCTLTSRSIHRHSIEIPVHLIRNQEGLDEMVGVAFAAMAQRETWPDVVQRFQDHELAEEEFAGDVSVEEDLDAGVEKALEAEPEKAERAQADYEVEQGPRGAEDMITAQEV
jgi:hypothetical protein